MTDAVFDLAGARTWTNGNHEIKAQGKQQSGEKGDSPWSNPVLYAERYSITYVLQHCVGAHSNPTSVGATSVDAKVASFTADAGYQLTMSSVAVTGSGKLFMPTSDGSRGTLYLSGFTDNIVVTVIAVRI